MNNVKSYKFALLSIIFSSLIFLAGALVFLTSYFKIFPETHPLAQLTFWFLFLSYVAEVPLLYFSGFLGFPLVLPILSLFFAFLSFKKKEGKNWLLFISILLIVATAIAYKSAEYINLYPEMKERVFADSQEPASGICEFRNERTVNIAIGLDSPPTPRCIKVWGDSRLSFSNTLNQEVSFSIGDQIIVVPANSSKELDFPAINYFAPGAHIIRTIGGIGSIPELWILLPAAKSELAAAPEFEEYPADRFYNGTPASVNFDSYPQAKMFKTIISRDSAVGPNFAGHYTIVTWGCGTQCQAHAIVDAENGNIVAYGIPSTLEISYRIDSRLFIVNPNPGPEVKSDIWPVTVSDFYVINDGKLLPLGRFDFRSGIYEPVGCPDIETKGRNVITGETKKFTAPCLLPYGWEIIQ